MAGAAASVGSGRVVQWSLPVMVVMVVIVIAKVNEWGENAVYCAMSGCSALVTLYCAQGE